MMKKVRITVMRKACYEDLMAKYENPIEDACTVEEGQVFIADGWRRPEGLCERDRKSTRLNSSHP